MEVETFFRGQEGQEGEWSGERASRRGHSSVVAGRWVAAGRRQFLEDVEAGWPAIAATRLEYRRLFGLNGPDDLLRGGDGSPQAASPILRPGWRRKDGRGRAEGGSPARSQRSRSSINSERWRLPPPHKG